MASTAMLQTARAPLGVSGLLDAAAGGLFCSVTFMILRFWRLAPPETTKALSLARRRFCYFSGSGCWCFRLPRPQSPPGACIGVVVDALRLLVRCPRADLSAAGRAAFKERIHGRCRRGVGVERAPRRLTCRGDSAAIWPAIVASSRRRSASSRAVSLFASSAMRASHSASASGVMRLIRVPGISSSLGPRPRFFNL
jgi:hypothetical protein